MDLHYFAIVHICSVLVSKLAQAKYVTPVLKSKWKYEKVAAAVRVLQSTQNLLISCCCFAEDGKEI